MARQLPAPHPLAQVDVTLPRAAPALMGAVVIGPVQQPDAVRADPEVLHQGGGTAKIGGAMPDPGLPLVLPARLAGQPDLAPFAQGELLRGEGVKQLGPTPGAGKIRGPRHGQFGHQDAAIGQGGEAVDALAKRPLRPLGQKLLRIDPAKGALPGPDLHQPQLGAGEAGIEGGLLLAGKLPREPGEQGLQPCLRGMGAGGRHEGDGRRPDQAGVKQPQQGRHQLCHRILPSRLHGGDYMSER